MKICVIICEFNPFHNGHKYLLEQAKLNSGCEKTICIMNGDFTQRGELCVLDKFTRARHAIEGGADAVLELPVSFSVAPAEIFASGAVKILNSIPSAGAIVFGCENSSADFKKAAGILIDESTLFKNTLKSCLERGESYIKSYAEAFAVCGGDKNLLSNPNNILGAEYCKALLRAGKDIDVIPVQRVGSGYSDENLLKNFSSASAIRKNIGNADISTNVPGYVFKDLVDFSAAQKLFEELIGFKLLASGTETLKKIYGCGEGLENRLKNLSSLPYEKIIGEATGKRYSSSRIKRILLANLLDLYAGDAQKFLESPLYLRPLAIKKESADLILPELAKSEYPVIYKQRDLNNLGKTAEKCFEKDCFAHKIWNFIFKKPDNGFDYPIFAD